LSTLSPCVLPLLPLVVGGAANACRYGMGAMIAGLVVSFVTIGLFVATVGFAIGIDDDLFRTASAVMLAILGIVLLSGALQRGLAAAASGVGTTGHNMMARITPGHVWGQFGIGLVLGAVWSPCVGPTLGAASVLAAQGRDLGVAAVVMAAFGAGAALPLILIGSLSREALIRWRGRMQTAGRTGKVIMGSGALAISALILTGLDRHVETLLVENSPDWLTALTTRF
jgi:cytochrome c biogenesis protein CcdA